MLLSTAQRGAKFSNWQGGVHVAAFVSGGALPPARRGIKLQGLTTIWDLYATFGVAGGLSEAEATEDAAAAAAGLPAVDSISQWGYWNGSVTTPPRTELAIGGEVGNENGAGGGVRFRGPTSSNTGVEALIWGTPGKQFKLMVGTFHEAAWTGPEWPNSSSTSFAANNSHWLVTADCRAGCLFDISETMHGDNEHTDLAATQPDMVKKMRARLEQINATVFSPNRGPADKELGCNVALNDYSGFW